MSETEVVTEGNIEISDDLDDFSTDFFGQKQGEEKPAATTEGTEQDDEAQTSEDTEAQTDTEKDDDTEANQEEETPPEKPKKKTFQDRIDELVRQREDQKRQDDAEKEALRLKIEELEKKITPADVSATASTAKEPTPEDVDKDGNPLYPLGEFDPQYIRDLTRFTLKQEEERVKAERAEQERVAKLTEAQQALQTQWNERVEKVKDEYPDFVEKGRELLNGFNDLDQNYAGYLSNVIMSMEKGPDVLYYLSTHPDEAAAIVNSGAQKATLALGRIEARFLQSEQAAPKPKVSKAPPPPPVQARGTHGAHIETAPDTDDLDAFEASFFRKK